MAQKENERKEFTKQLKDEGVIVYQSSLERELDDAYGAFTALIGKD